MQLVWLAVAALVAVVGLLVAPLLVGLLLVVVQLGVLGLLFGVQVELLLAEHLLVQVLGLVLLVALRGVEVERVVLPLLLLLLSEGTLVRVGCLGSQVLFLGCLGRAEIEWLVRLLLLLQHLRNILLGQGLDYLRT